MKPAPPSRWKSGIGGARWCRTFVSIWTFAVGLRGVWSESSGEVLENGYAWSMEKVPDCGPLAIRTDLLPSSLDKLLISGHGRVTLVVTVFPAASNSSSDSHQNATENSTYILTVASEDTRIAVTSGYSFGLPDSRYEPELDSSLASCHRNLTASFTVRGLKVGRTVLVVGVVCGGVLEQRLYCRVSVVRRWRLIDRAFNWAIAVMTVINSFSLGCVTDVNVLRQQLRCPSISIILTATFQLFVLPIFSVGVARGFLLNPQLEFGLLLVGCAPGGGLGYIIACAINGRKTSSACFNCISTLGVLVTSPLWLLSLSQLLSVEPDFFIHPIILTELLLAINAATYLTGMILRRRTAKSADGFLNWCTVPILLLYFLLFTTTGVYVNSYAFDLLDARALAAALIMPAAGQLLTLAVCCVLRQEPDVTKTVSTESAVFNCLMSIAVVRFSLDQPDADVASAMPLMILFTSPTTIVVMRMCNSLHKRIQKRYCGNRHERLKRRYSIVSSLLNVAAETEAKAPLKASGNSTGISCESPTDDQDLTLNEDDQTVRLL